MSDPMKLVSEAFKAFREEAPDHAEAWMSAAGHIVTQSLPPAIAELDSE